MRIAVIGGGIGGLAAGWFLGQSHEVVLFERHATPGMAAHGVRVCEGGAEVVVDVPARVFHRGYYPNLLALYARAGVETERVDYRASFTDLDSGVCVPYRTLSVGRWAVPLVGAGHAGALQREALRFQRRGPRHLRRGALEGLSLADYLAQEGYGERFVRQILLPPFAAILTCTYEQLLGSPAAVVVGYVAQGGYQSRVGRARGGTVAIVNALRRPIAEVRCGAQVGAVRQQDDRAIVEREGEPPESFDHVVVATQANVARRLIQGGSGAEAEILGRFRYHPSRIVVHRDDRLAPAEEHRMPVNFLVSADHDAPMATLSMNIVQSELRDFAPLWQTWNPIREPRPDLVVGDTTLERPIVDAAGLEAIAMLEALHREADRRIWLCGSYAQAGIPLLESAVTSAQAVADQICGGVPLAGSYPLEPTHLHRDRAP